MNKNTIEYLAYLLNKAHKEEGKEKAIIFLGAGTSVSAGIPLTDTIVRHIKVKFYNNPIIKECIKTKKDDYYSLMGALTADERRDLFHFYVTRDKVKLNIANIYLAQLLKVGYVDYIVTVNFDDLILKACTLYNFLPPVYDISNIKTITTTDIRKNSVIYLHGQYFGQWLLNNPDELQKVEEEVLSLFNAIKTRRTWIIIGYSGNDGIFDKIKSLGSFSSELFWVKKKLDAKQDEKIINFLQTENLNANKIEGYYADSFFLRLHAELSKLNEDLEAPEIISKPFTFVKSVLQSINEIKEDDELNDNVKKMIINCNERIDKAIAEYEDEGTEENLKHKIVDALLKGNFNEEEVLSFENEAKQNNYQNVAEQLSWYYNEWGNALSDLAKEQNDEILFRKSFEKYKKASELASKDEDVFFNWGNALLDLARLKNNESLFKESIEKYKIASERNPKDADVFNNWGNALLDLARLKNNESLFEESIEKYKIASECKPKDSGIFYNWGTALLALAIQNNDESIFRESFKKYKIASELDQKNANVFNNWGNALVSLAKQQKDEVLFRESIEKYEKASELDPKDSGIFYNWGTALSDLAIQNNDESMFRESFKKYKIASELDQKNANVFYNWGIALFNLAKQNNDEILFRESFEKYRKASELTAEHKNLYYNWGTALSYCASQNNDEALFKESFEKYKKASELNPKEAGIFNNWGIALSNLAKQNNNESIFRESFKKYKIASELDHKNVNVFYNWGIALSHLAIQNNDEVLFRESIEKYKTALELDSTNTDILNSLGTNLIHLGKLLNDDKHFTEALEISRKVYELGGSPYNFSCGYALLSDKKNALKYLKETLDKQLITIEHINEDEDWEAYRNDEEFIILINQYK